MFAHGFFFLWFSSELIITAGGENVPPVLIEDMVKEELACVSNCMLIGDKKKFLSMLITLKVRIRQISDACIFLLFASFARPICIHWVKYIYQNFLGSNIIVVSLSQTEVDPETAFPLDELAGPALDWCKAQGSQAKSVSDVLDTKDEAVLKGIQAGIDRVNKRATSNAQKIQKWSIIPRDFSIPGEELGEWHSQILQRYV